MAQQVFFSLTYLPMKITLVSLDKAVLPMYLGSTLRGAIGQALYKDQNSYNYLYNNKSLNNGQKDVLNPYLIVLPDNSQNEFMPEEELSFNFFLLGEAVEFVKPLINALGEETIGLGVSRYPFKLKQVKHEIDQRIIWENGKYYEIAVQSSKLPFKTLPDVTRIIIRTRTPLRIRRNGELLQIIDFVTLIRNITNRLTAISERYGGWVDQGEVARVQSLAAQVITIKNQFELKPLTRYSNRLGEKMDFSGLVGEMEIHGDLTPFVPWLFAGQILHIGRNTTFGMGRIDVEFI